MATLHFLHTDSDGDELAVTGFIYDDPGSSNVVISANGQNVLIRGDDPHLTELIDLLVEAQESGIR